MSKMRKPLHQDTALPHKSKTALQSTLTLIYLKVLLSQDWIKHSDTNCTNASHLQRVTHFLAVGLCSHHNSSYHRPWNASLIKSNKVDVRVAAFLAVDQYCFHTSVLVTATVSLMEVIEIGGSGWAVHDCNGTTRPNLCIPVKLIKCVWRKWLRIIKGSLRSSPVRFTAIVFEGYLKFVQYFSFTTSHDIQSLWHLKHFKTFQQHYYCTWSILQYFIFARWRTSKWSSFTIRNVLLQHFSKPNLLQTQTYISQGQTYF